MGLPQNRVPPDSPNTPMVSHHVPHQHGNFVVYICFIYHQKKLHPPTEIHKMVQTTHIFDPKLVINSSMLLFQYQSIFWAFFSSANSRYFCGIPNYVPGPSGTKGCQNVPEVQSTSPEAVHRPTHELASRSADDSVWSLKLDAIIMKVVWHKKRVESVYLSVKLMIYI